jgi:hypothetical protein
MKFYLYITEGTIITKEAQAVSDSVVISRFTVFIIPHSSTYNAKYLHTSVQLFKRVPTDKNSLLLQNLKPGIEP